MFAIPGIAALMIFILARPQEFLPLLQRVPFLHLFTVLAVVGWVIDVRLRRLQPVGTPALPWAVCLLGWAVVTVAIVVPDQLIPTTIEMAIKFVLYATIAHGIQRFRTFQAVAGVLAVTSLFIAFVCFHQGLSPKQCVGGMNLSSSNELLGKPDGRVCENIEHCYGADAEPGFEYSCEHVGLFGTYSVEERIRYRGELQDPNEVALAICAGGLSLLVAFARRKKNPISVFGCIMGIALVIATIMMSKSRGGQLCMMLVFGVYIVRRYGLWTMVPAGVMGLALVMLGGRGGAKADMSTQQRYEAWSAGLSMFKQSPGYGVGAGQFGEHHYLTAHNSFVLAMAEMGFIGLVLFVCVVYVSIKSLVVGLRTLKDMPGSEAATVWGMALLASFCGLLFQINTLSFTYHSVLWIFFGLIGAWTNAIRTHFVSFQVKITWRDFVVIVLACIAYVTFLLPVLLRLKGEA